MAKLLAVTRDQVAEMARRLLRPEHFTLEALGPSSGAELGEKDWP